MTMIAVTYGYARASKADDESKCPASTRNAGALPHPNRYPTKVIASHTSHLRSTGTGSLRRVQGRAGKTVCLQVNHLADAKTPIDDLQPGDDAASSLLRSSSCLSSRVSAHSSSSPGLRRLQRWPSSFGTMMFSGP